MRRPSIPGITLILTLIMLIAACQPPLPKERNNEEESTTESAPTVDTANGLFAQMVTNKGSMIIRLEPDKAPMTVANFIALAEGNMPNSFRKPGQPYYDSLKFHRVISLTNGDRENFMVQGGDPLGTGQGGPGYTFKDEFSDLKLDRPGVLAMANSGPATNGSQFFITLKATPWLDGVHTVFGNLITGTEIPFLIKTNDTIYRVRILKKGEKYHAYDAMTEFNKYKTAK